jgi:acyl-CoA synthetase (AMP-forming)/AMP-acid ligase II
VLEHARTLWELIDTRAGDTPGRVMLIDGDRTTTFGEYRDLVLRAAAGYHALGIGASSRVSWQLPTWTESAVLVGALARLDALQNPMLPIYRYREVSFIARQARSEWIVTPSTWGGFDHAALAAQVAGERAGLRTLVADRHNPDGDPATLPPPPDPSRDEPVRWIFYTSGTTADPKGAQHTDRTVIAGAVGYAKKTHVGADDISLVAFPFTHIGGVIIGVFTPLLTGSAAVLMETWSAGASTELIERHRVTLGNGAPAIHAALVAEARAHPGAYESIRAFPSGGSTKPPQLHDDALAVVPGCAGITSGYGMTEAPIVAQTDVDAPDESKRIAEGTPTQGVEMKMLDANGDEVAHGEEGEIVVRGPQVMRGYVDASLDADVFTADGFLRTGDIGRFDEHGAVVITGRIKDIIIRKGENVSAKEVEDVLFGHRAIADVAVFGMPDAERGEMVCAAIVPAPGTTAPSRDDIVAFCRQQGLMIQKVPERIELVEVLPRTPSGKVPKHELRARFTRIVGQ